MTLHASANAFRTVLGDGRATLVEDPDHDLPPNPAPLLLLHPATVDVIPELFRVAQAERLGLVVVGGNTCPRLPAKGAPPAALLSTRDLARIVEHAVDDLTLTVEAGVPFLAAQGHVAASAQRLGFLPPLAHRATLGGIVACAAEGPTRHADGALRDQILGIEVLHGDGRATKAGGRVVKNVTGYDLCRLYCGARGALGLVTRITFRLRPIPKATGAMLWRFPSGKAATEAGLDLRRLQTALSTIQVLSPRRSGDLPGHGFAVLATCQGAPSFVQAIEEESAGFGIGGERPMILATPIPLPTPDPKAGEAWLRITVLPSDTPRLLECIRTHAGDALDLSVDVLSGTADIILARDALSPSMEAALRADLSRLGAHVDQPTDPLWHLRAQDVESAERRDARDLMSALRQTLDPGGLLNPGRTGLE